jgi:hypothetical protein
LSNAPQCAEKDEGRLKFGQSSLKGTADTEELPDSEESEEDRFKFRNSV